MDLFEYQGKRFFAQYGMPVSAGEVALTVDEAVDAAERLGTPVMVKAQVHTGGRGKAGGSKFAATLDDVRTHANDILGLDIRGHVVGRVWIEKASDIADEYYASFTLDRSAKKHLGMLSAEGASKSRRWRSRTLTPSPKSGLTRSTGWTRPRPVTGSMRPTCPRRPWKAPWTSC